MPAYSVHTCGKTIVFRPDSGFGPEAAQALREEAGRLCSRPELQHLLLHLEHVTFVDSTVIGVLVSLHAELAEARKAMHLYRPSENLHKIFTLVQLSQVFHFLEEVEEVTALGVPEWVLDGEDAGQETAQEAGPESDPESGTGRG